MIEDKDLPSFNVSSLTVPNKFYNVFYDRHKEQFRCECRHFALFQDEKCNHIQRVRARISYHIKHGVKSKI